MNDTIFQMTYWQIMPTPNSNAEEDNYITHESGLEGVIKFPVN